MRLGFVKQVVFKPGVKETREGVGASGCTDGK